MGPLLRGELPRGVRGRLSGGVAKSREVRVRERGDVARGAAMVLEDAPSERLASVAGGAFLAQLEFLMAAETRSRSVTASSRASRSSARIRPGMANAGFSSVSVSEDFTRRRASLAWRYAARRRSASASRDSRDAFAAARASDASSDADTEDSEGATLYDTNVVIHGENARRAKRARARADGRNDRPRGTTTPRRNYSAPLPRASLGTSLLPPEIFGSWLTHQCQLLARMGI